MQHRCVVCGALYPTGFHPFCGQCGGMVDVEYDLASVKLADSSNPYIRFAELLPLRQLHSRLPRAGYTPMIHAIRLGGEIGMPALYLKDESALPTRTTKDRMASIALAYLLERGIHDICASSTGNSGTSLAAGIRAHPEMRLFLFTAEEFVPRVQFADHAQVVHFGLRDATFVDAAAYAGAYARKHGLDAESGFFNPARREGLKLAFLEASEQAPQPIDWYVQAVSSAMGVYGAFKGAKELLQLKRLGRLPRLLCVQQETCAPMARAFADGSDQIRPGDIVARPSGIAKAILRGDPTRAYPYVRGAVLESGGTFAAVSEDEIRDARRKVEDLEGISPCFSASTALAGLIKLVREDGIPRNSTVVVNLTGAERPDEPIPSNITWLDRSGATWSDGWEAPEPAAFGRQPAFASPAPSI